MRTEQKCYNGRSFPGFPKPHMAGTIIHLAGEVVMIAVRYISLVPASNADLSIVAANLVVTGAYRGAHGGHTACKHT